MVDVNLPFISDESKEKLILEVIKFPCLYDPSRGTYHIKQARIKAWAQVAINCGCPNKEELCKVAWKRLKEKFRREREKLSNCRPGAAPSQVKPWCLYQAMTFVEPFCQPRLTSTSLEMAQSTMSAVEYNDRNDDDIECSPAMSQDNSFISCDQGNEKVAKIEENPTSSPSVSTSFPTSFSRLNGENSPSLGRLCTTQALPRKRKRNSCEIDANENEESCTPALVVAMNKAQSDAVAMFYQSMAEEARKLPIRKRQELQLKIMELTFQYCAEEEK